MSIIFKLTGNSSVLSSNFTPPIILEDNVDYSLGLTVFETYHSIPNVIDGENNMFYYGNGEKITLPTGSYELSSIESYIQSQLEVGDFFSLTPDPTTLKCKVKFTKQIDFTKPNTIASILGFKQVMLSANKVHNSDETVKIMSVNSVCIYCNITTGAYDNGVASHLIHHFFPVVPPGSKIVEAPEHVIYLPINSKTISNLTISVADQNGKLLNLRGEIVTVGLHLKPV